MRICVYCTVKGKKLKRFPRRCVCVCIYERTGTPFPQDGELKKIIKYERISGCLLPLFFNFKSKAEENNMVIDLLMVYTYQGKIVSIKIPAMGILVSVFEYSICGNIRDRKGYGRSSFLHCFNTSALMKITKICLLSCIFECCEYHRKVTVL